MNFRTTIILVIVLAVVALTGAVYTATRSNNPPEQVSIPREFFYLADDDDINTVKVVQNGQTAEFRKDAEGTWRFADSSNAEVFMERWGGVTLLLSGPQYKRVISEQATDLARYGLAEPPIVISVGLRNQGNVEIRLGDKTPDGSSHYAQYEERPAIYTVDSSWGDVIGRLVTEPPHIPTPTPEPSPTPEGGATPEGEATPVGGASPEGGATPEGEATSEGESAATPTPAGTAG